MTAGYTTFLKDEIDKFEELNKPQKGKGFNLIF
jgi:hypothetical protein